MQLMQPVFGKAKHSREYNEYLTRSFWRKLPDIVYFDWVQLVVSILVLLAPFPLMYDWSYTKKAKEPQEVTLVGRASL